MVVDYMNLAIKNGPPLRSKPYHKWPLQDEEVKAALQQLFDQAEWGNGASDKLLAFERKFNRVTAALEGVA